MKILFVSPDIFSFHNFRLNLVNKLIELGNEVILISPVKTSDKIRIDAIKKLGLKIIKINLNKNKVNPFSDIIYIFNLILKILKYKPNIIFSYTIKPVIYSGIALYIVSFFLPLLINNKAIIVKYNNEYYYPVFSGYIAGATFNQDVPGEARYRTLQNSFQEYHIP